MMQRRDQCLPLTCIEASGLQCFSEAAVASSFEQRRKRVLSRALQPSGERLQVRAPEKRQQRNLGGHGAAHSPCPSSFS
jgi:hypothetical protein